MTIPATPPIRDLWTAGLVEGQHLVFGPTFADELRAAGLFGLITWRVATGEIFGREDLTAEQSATLDAVIAAHDPAKTRVPAIISRRQFFQAAAGRGMITQQEALDAVRHGTIPAQMQQGIDTLSPEE